MAKKVTKIKAQDDKPVKKPTKEPTKKVKEKVAPQPQKKSEKKSEKKPFILFRPFIALGHYLRDSWRELRQVRWPNRKATWKMVVAVLVYTAIFAVFLTLLDLLFQLIFSNILK